MQKVETFNGEQVPVPRDNAKMNDLDKLASMQNALKILPPNLLQDGRHSPENVQAICGFPVTEEMLNAAYERL